MDKEYINEKYMEILENYISGEKETMKELLVPAIAKLIEKYIITKGNLKTTKDELRDYVYNSIPEVKVKEKIEELNKLEKEQLKRTKGQDRYAIKQEFMFKRNILQELLEK